MQVCVYWLGISCLSCWVVRINFQGLSFLGIVYHFFMLQGVWRCEFLSVAVIYLSRNTELWCTWGCSWKRGGSLRLDWNHLLFICCCSGGFCFLNIMGMWFVPLLQVCCKISDGGFRGCFRWCWGSFEIGFHVSGGEYYCSPLPFFLGMNEDRNLPVARWFYSIRYSM